MLFMSINFIICLGPYNTMFIAFPYEKIIPKNEMFSLIPKEGVLEGVKPPHFFVEGYI